MTNVSSRKAECDLLLQIPAGGLPIGNSAYIKSHSVTLESYTTKKFEYKFYLPNPGEYQHFPVNVSYFPKNFLCLFPQRAIE